MPSCLRKNPPIILTNFMCALPVQKTTNMSQSILLKINLSAVKTFLLEDKKGFPTVFLFDTLVDNIKLL